MNVFRNISERGFFFSLFHNRRLKQRLLSVVLLAFICQLTIPYLTTNCPVYAAGSHVAKPHCPLAVSAKQAAAVDPAKPAPHQSHADGSCPLCAVSGPGGLYLATGFQPLPLPPMQADVWLPARGDVASVLPVTGSFSARAPPA